MAPAVPPSPAAARGPIITSQDVKDRELWHVRGDTSSDAPLVGLALSGGGIRSACFGLGVLQALHKLKLFRHLDYVSTVSGGGYIGGWLQAAIANDRPGAIELKGEEPREIRFLRAYSNYLTPKLGLFSGDTWAAVGNSLRNLILNFTILSLTLLAPLYLPWLAAAIFWALVPEASGEGPPLAVAGALFVLTVAASIANTARPVRTTGGTKVDASHADQLTVYLTVIVPGLVAVWLMSTVMWAWARDTAFTASASARVAWYAALFYAAIWALGLIGGFAWRRLKKRSDEGYGRPGAAVVLVVSGSAAGALGTFLMGLATHALALTFQGSAQLWLAGLLTFPIGVICLMLALTAHIGLAGGAMSDETREWWGRVGGVQLLISLLLIVVGVLALGGPHIYAMVRPQWKWLADNQGAISAVLSIVWVVLTAAGVVAGRSQQTATGRGNRLLELAGRVAPMAFVVGYLFILAVFMHRVVPQFTIPLGGGNQYSVYSLCQIEARMRSAAVAQTPGGTLPAAAAIGSRNDRAMWHVPCESGTVPGGTGGAIPGLLLMILASGTLAWLISRQVNLNEFSLHTFYRNRLVRCFLGASRQRTPHPFTGFDDEDDLPLAALAATRPDGRIRPYPIFNTAINLVAGKNLAWQERKAASFVFTPEYCGFEYRDDDDPPAEPKAAARREAEDVAVQQQAHDSGVVTRQAVDAGVKRLSAYAKTAEHAGDPRSLTMGLAIATSGAAASPNMGYHSSPTLAFLMTVFNVRLGWWLRNPRDPKVWTDRGASVSLRELLYELLGMTTDDKKWVYLSDGGHFENLGVYELVRRRCKLIIACDAGQDGAVTFEDLGNAIERCRADFGVDIEIDLTRLRPGPDRRAEWHCAIGTIRYDRLPPVKQDDPIEVPGTLLYIKSSLTGDEPADILRYAAEHPAFPHESTNDQFFDESQFESYRALGYHATEDVFTRALRADECGALQPVEIFTLLRQRWGTPAPAPLDAERKYSASLDRIWTVLRTSKTLNFLDGQMFPEMPALMGLPPEALPRGVQPPPRGLPDVNYWLPKTEAERREGFYVCVQMLQLMEDVFLDFDLDEYYDHIDNRGWMNLFQHWAWSGMLCATWAMTGSTFDPRFQRFCWTRLDLRPGRPSVAKQAVQLPDPGQWRAWSKAAAAAADQHTDCAELLELNREMERWQIEAGLNFWEVELVAKYLRATSRPMQKLFPVFLTVESPRRTDGNPLCFNVGYIIGDIEVQGRPGPTLCLHYMRIQNHLRKMGLARDALMAIRTDLQVALDVPAPDFDPGALDQSASDEALPTEDAVNRLRAIIRSLP
ncbi:MAG TPA: patatin-like phospholipase family protein [Vicinamibacterales bacterium]|nr:patatin-like phospholipase family protein [Vicinamibacterales bacterium]